jgi:hypothetical protein
MVLSLFGHLDVLFHKFICSVFREVQSYILQLKFRHPHTHIQEERLSGLTLQSQIWFSRGNRQETSNLVIGNLSDQVWTPFIIDNKPLIIISIVETHQKNGNNYKMAFLNVPET